MTDFYKTGFAQLSTQDSYGDRAEESRLNPYFDRYGYSQVQSLHDSLTGEAIQFGGVEVIYFRREMMNVDPVFGEDPTSAFNEAYPISVYIENFDSWEGERDFFGKFGYTASDELTLSINDRLFKSQVDGDNPAEGDLVYFPMGNTLLEITFIEDEDDFFIHGHLPTRRITLQKFSYNGETITDQYDSDNDGIADSLIAELTNLNDVTTADDDESDRLEFENSTYQRSDYSDPFENSDF